MGAPPLTPSATPDRKNKKGGKKQQSQSTATAALQPPLLPNLYDPTVHPRALSGLTTAATARKRVAASQRKASAAASTQANSVLGILTPPESDRGSFSDSSDDRDLVVTDGPDAKVKTAAEARFTFAMEVGVLTRRLSELHTAIATEKREREATIRQAMQIAVEQQREAREGAAAGAATEPTEADGTVAKASGQKVAATATGGATTSPTVEDGKVTSATTAPPPPPTAGGKKKKGKKKRSAHANANNVHHRDNYVPSRYPASTSAYHSHHAGPNGEPMMSPSELIEREVEGQAQGKKKGGGPPKYRKDHIFIDPNTTFPGVEPHASGIPATGGSVGPPAHAQLGPSATAAYFADPDEWICGFCEYELWFGEEPLLVRALKNRKAVLKRRKKARDRAARAAAGGSAAKSASATTTTAAAAPKAAPAASPPEKKKEVTTAPPPPTRQVSPAGPPAGQKVKSTAQSQSDHLDV